MGSRKNNGFEGFGSKREEGIWGLVQERRRDLGFGSVQERRKDLGGLVQREKKGFRVLIQH